jgi:phenylpyruvate tautomerase PptA (4-oxalocrotonate tautomerase family)
MMEALKIPVYDKTIRVVEYLPEYFSVPPGATENYTLVEIDMFSGRSMSTKKALYSVIVRNLGEQGIKPNDIKIVLREISAENWGIRGGIPASEVDLGFKIDV